MFARNIGSFCAGEPQLAVTAAISPKNSRFRKPIIGTSPDARANAREFSHAYRPVPAEARHQRRCLPLHHLQFKNLRLLLIAVAFEDVPAAATAQE